MSKLSNYIGIAVGIVILIFAIVVFSFQADIAAPSFTTIYNSIMSAPEYEPDLAYGGDAYTGMQQASAQAANNLIPVFEAVKQTNASIKDLNENLEKQARREAGNMEALVKAITNCFGYLLLSMGLLTVVKYGAPLIVIPKKETVAEDTPEEPACEEDTQEEAV